MYAAVRMGLIVVRPSLLLGLELPGAFKLTGRRLLSVSALRGIASLLVTKSDYPSTCFAPFYTNLQFIRSLPRDTF